MERYDECSWCGYIYSSENEEPDYVGDDEDYIDALNEECTIGKDNDQCEAN